MPLPLFLPCAAGVEALLAEEIERICPKAHVFETRGGVALEGDPLEVMTLNLESRLAQRVLIDIPVGPTAKVRSAEAAAALDRDLVTVGAALGLEVRCVRTDGTQPVGWGIGPALEHAAMFPKRANIGFVQILSHDRFRLRVWERSAGLTLACGSGACAAMVNAARRGLTGRRAHVIVDGGELDMAWREDGHVMMTGPVATSYRGLIDLQ